MMIFSTQTARLEMKITKEARIEINRQFWYVKLHIRARIIYLFIEKKIAR